MGWLSPVAYHNYKIIKEIVLPDGVDYRVPKGIDDGK